MSRPTDAFSSLMADVPGVDCKLFEKRSLNELKTKHSGETSRERSRPVTDIQEPVPQTVPQQTQPDLAFSSLDLDGLGKPATPNSNQPTALADLFGHVPGCQDTQETPEQTHIPPPLSCPFAADLPESVYVEERREEMETQTNDVQEAFDTDTQQTLESAEQEQEFTASGNWKDAYLNERSSSSELRKRLAKYRTKLNKKAGDLKKRGIQAMKQGFDAAQEWMDKVVEERKVSNQSTAQRKEEAREIEHFLAEMERLSHYRREQLMSDIQPEFFQRVVDYAEAKGIAIEHLFLTSESHAPDESPRSHQDEARMCDYLNVTGDDSEGNPEMEDAAESVESEKEEECDLLGLSTNPDHHPVEAAAPTENIELASPDDLDAFFTGGASPVASKPPMTDIYYEEEDLMAFEGGSTSVVKSDLSAMYSRLKQAGQHTEEEIRSILKDRRKREKESKMAAALQAKVDRERENEEEQELLHALKQQHLQKIVSWKEKHANNMRGLLTTLQTVLWEDSGWKTLTVGDVLEQAQVKKAYMKANLIIHPDKVKQKGGSPEQVVLADMVFNVLKEAWQNFQS